MRLWAHPFIMGLTVAASLGFAWFSGSSWAKGKNTETQLSETQWQQAYFNGRLRLIYDPEDFLAGLPQIAITVKNDISNEVSLNYDLSNFVDKELSERVMQYEEEWEEFLVEIPPNAESTLYEYELAFYCKGRYATHCDAVSFYLPIMNYKKPILDVKLTKNPISVSVMDEHTLVNLIFTSKTAYSVMDIQYGFLDDSDKKAGFSESTFLRPGPKSSKIVDNIPIIKSYQEKKVRLKFTHSGYWMVFLNYALWDLIRTPDKLMFDFYYTDKYQREWPNLEYEANVVYDLNPFYRTLYHVILIGVACFLGTLTRRLIRPLIPEALGLLRSWRASALLAGVCYLVALILQLKIDLVGVFEIDFTKTRGVVLFGIATGLYPELIKSQLDSYFQRKKSNAGPA